MPTATATPETVDAAPAPQPRGRRTVALRSGALVAAVAVGIVAATAACTPEDFARVAIEAHFGSLSGIATQIAQCESRLQPTAVSPGGGNVGLFQINKVNATWIKSDLGYSWSQMTDADVNARVARALYDRAHGWSPWHGTCGGRLGI